MTSDDAKLFARLRDMWWRRDPVPEGFAQAMVVAVATHDLSAEYELFTMLETPGRLAGVRGSSDARTLQFAAGETDAVMTMVLRISPIDDGADGAGRRRLDGWIAPPAEHAVRVEVDHEHFATDSTLEGRFEFGALPAGTATVWIEPSAVGAHRPGPALTTPAFDL